MMAPVDVAERGRTTVTDALVDAVPAAFWAAAGCEVRKAPGDADWTVQTGDLVGVSRVTTPAGEVTLRVRPKLDTADVFFLADYAYDQRHEPLRALPFDQVEMEALLRDPSACLLAWHARSIRQFAARRGRVHGLDIHTYRTPAIPGQQCQSRRMADGTVRRRKRLAAQKQLRCLVAHIADLQLGLGTGNRQLNF